MSILTTPRNVRNNNPLNLRRSSAKWQGRKNTVTDPAFEEFTSMDFGMRAGLINMRTQLGRRDNKCMPLSALVALWAPACDGNNPVSYTTQVARATAIAPSKLISFSDRNTICAVAWAMSQVEGKNTTTITDWQRIYDSL